MLAVLVSLAAAAWETRHLGSPLFARERDGDMLIYTKDNVVGLLNGTSGEVIWTTYFEGIEAFDIYRLDIVLASEFYWYFVDADTANLIYQVKHDVGKVKDMSFFDDKIAILGEKKLQVFQAKDLLWEKEISADRVECTLEKVIVGGDAYDLLTGEKSGAGEVGKRDEYTFKWTPTVIETYKNGEFAWRLDEPLYGSKLLTALSSKKIVLENATGIMVFDVELEKLVFYQESHILSFGFDSNLFVFETRDGLFGMNPKSLQISPYTKKVYRVTQTGSTITANGQDFVFPAGFKPVCQASCSAGSALSVAQSGNDIISVVIAHTGKIQALAHVENVEFGTCWCGNNSASVSYVRQGNAFVSSFAFQKAGATRGFKTTDGLITAAGNSYFMLKNGKLVQIPSDSIHGDVPMTPTGIMASVYSPEVAGVNVVGAWGKVDNIVDRSNCLALQGYNVYVLSSSGDDVMEHLAVMLGPALFSLFFVYSIFRSKASSFWK